MFLGEYDHSLDTKGRLIIPSKFREALGESCVLTCGFDKCLCLYRWETWNAFVEKLEQLPQNEARYRKVRRYFMAWACEAEPDKQGRIVLPARLREAAGIVKDVVTVGMGSRIEIWGRENWQDDMSSEELDGILREMLDNGLEI